MSLTIKVRHGPPAGDPNPMRGDKEFLVCKGEQVIGRYDTLAEAKKAHPEAKYNEGDAG